MSDDALVGKLLFGRPARLRLLRWIWANPKPRFYQSEPPSDVASLTEIRQELPKYVMLGLLEEEHPDGESRIYYVRTDSPLWQIVDVVGRVLASGSE